MKPDFCFFPRMITLDEVQERLPSIQEIMKKYGVSIAYLFGSILFKDVARKDVDIGIYVEKPVKSILDYYCGIYDDLCQVFNADNIDVAMLNNTNPAFCYEVISKGKVIYYHNPEVLNKFIEEILFIYDDLRSFRYEYEKELYKAIKEGLLSAKRTISRQKINLFIDNISMALKKIRHYLESVGNSEEFINNYEIRELCIHHLRIALEAVLDIARHIVAVKGLGIPDMERKNLLDVLGDEGIIPYDFSKKIRGMQGIRNAIVHVYWSLDYKKTYHMITEELKDFEDFAKYILDYLEREA